MVSLPHDTFPSDPNSLKLWQALATCLKSSRCSSILMSLICFWKIQVEKSSYEEFEAMNASSDIFAGFALTASEDSDGQLKFKFVTLSLCIFNLQHMAN